MMVASAVPGITPIAPPAGALPMGELRAMLVEVDDYLCEVYWRMPVKRDSAGDFSWKDEAAADRAGRAVCAYAITGMAPALRLALYRLGKIADESGIRWSFLSGFRDDYRQSIASGFKARTGYSLHGGSKRTRGWGDGRAADLWTVGEDGAPDRNHGALFDLIDRTARGLGIARPMPGRDPGHVQLSR